jgi:hypothetical protein
LQEDYLRKKNHFTWGLQKALLDVADGGWRGWLQKQRASWLSPARPKF